jgi:hypothetical protein
MEVPIDEFEREENEAEDSAAAKLPEAPEGDDLPADDEVDEATKGD